MINRRMFLFGLTLGALATPLPGEAQQTGKIARIGTLSIAAAPSAEELARSSFRSAQGLDRQPGPSAGEILSHRAALVPTQPVPHQNEVAPRKVPLERAQKGDQREIVVTPGPRLAGRTRRPAARSPMLTSGGSPSPRSPSSGPGARSSASA
jgi:hypothetical protein